MVRDSRKRAVKDSAGNWLVFALRRFKCGQCGRLHIELHAFMCPHKHYSAKVIDAVVQGEVRFLRG